MTITYRGERFTPKTEVELYWWCVAKLAQQALPEAA